MRTKKHTAPYRLAALALLGALVAGCAKESPPPSEAAPVVTPESADAPGSPANEAPATDASSTDAPAPDATPGPEAMPPDSAPPADTAPSPTDPSATSKPTAAQLPPLESMKVAQGNGKLGVAADVRYSFDAAASPDQPVTLDIAVVPRVAGQALEFSLQPVDGVRVAAGPVTRLKVGQADTLRQRYSITRSANAPGALRVLVTHQWDGGSAFGFYSIPLD